MSLGKFFSIGTRQSLFRVIQFFLIAREMNWLLLTPHSEKAVTISPWMKALSACTRAKICELISAFDDTRVPFFFTRFSSECHCIIFVQIGKPQLKERLLESATYLLVCPQAIWILINLIISIYIVLFFVHYNHPLINYIFYENLNNNCNNNFIIFYRITHIRGINWQNI